MTRTSIAELVRSGVLTVGDGYRTKRSEHGTPGYRILRVADVVDGRASFTGEDFVSTEFAKQMGSKLSMAGDIVLTTKGTVGRVARIPAGSEQVVYSPQVCFFRVHDEAVLNGRYLEFWLRSDDFGQQASHRANNTDMAAYINLADIRSLTLDLPEAPEQQAIAAVLGAIDDKIAANSKLISTADELSRLKFESLLVASRLTPLSSLARFVNGKAFTKGASGTGRVVIRISELNSGLGASTVYNNIDVGEDHLARPGDLLFAWSGSLTVHRWFRPEGIINQHIFKVIPTAAPMWVVKSALDRKLMEFRAIASDKATTMGHIQRRHLDEPVEVPIGEIVQANSAAMDALWQRTLIAEQESLQLAATRDALLPLLMSRKIRVKDAEGVVEGVV